MEAQQYNSTGVVFTTAHRCKLDVDTISDFMTPCHLVNICHLLVKGAHPLNEPVNCLHSYLNVYMYDSILYIDKGLVRNLKEVQGLLEEGLKQNYQNW